MADKFEKSYYLFLLTLAELQQVIFDCAEQCLRVISRVEHGKFSLERIKMFIGIQIQFSPARTKSKLNIVTSNLLSYISI